MKLARFVLKVVAASLGAAALLCCIIAYWDKLSGCVCSVRNKFGTGGSCHSSEYDDYADWA